MAAYRRPLPPTAPAPPVRPVQSLTTPFGPCTRCQTRCVRYGPGGNPLCPACHPATAQGRPEAA